MALLDIFKLNAFGVLELTDAFQVKPNKYGRLNQLNLFPGTGVRTREVAIERKNGVLNLLPSVAPGAPATKGVIGKRDLRKVAVPHIPHEDTIMAEDVAGVRAFGSDNQLEAIQDLVNEKLATMAEKHDQTLEWLRWGAVHGVILDGDGTTELLDLFTEFGVTEEVQDFDLDNSSADVMKKIHALKRYMETHLFGDSMTGIRVFCAPDFFDALVSHTTVKDAYKYFQTNQPLSGEYRNRFEHGGIIFEEQNGTATAADGSTAVKFVADGTARVVPEGSSSMKTYFAPADFIETVNTPGLPRYAKQRILDYERGVEVHTQSNPLPVCLRPQLLVKLTRT